MAGLAMGFIAVWPGLPAGWFTSQEAAAWVQAIGSIGAILVAIAVPAKMERDRRRHQEEAEAIQGRALAVILAPSYSALLKDLMTIVERIEAFMPNAELMPNSPLTQNDWISIKLDVPDPLIGAAERMHLMGHAAGTQAVRAIAKAELYRVVWRREVALRGPLFLKVLKDLASAASEASRAARNDLRSIAGPPLFDVSRHVPTAPSGSGSTPQPAPSAAGPSVGPSSP